MSGWQLLLCENALGEYHEFYIAHNMNGGYTFSQLCEKRSGNQRNVTMGKFNQLWHATTGNYGGTPIISCAQGLGHGSCCGCTPESYLRCTHNNDTKTLRQRVRHFHTTAQVTQSHAVNGLPGWWSVSLSRDRIHGQTS